MLTCEQVAQLASDDAGDGVAPPQQLEVRDHLSSCLPCRRLYRHHRATLELLARLSDTDRSPLTRRDAERLAQMIAARLDFAVVH